MWRLSEKSTLEIFKLFNSNNITKVDDEITKVVYKYPELFELYGITAFGVSYVEYRGLMIWMKGGLK